MHAAQSQSLLRRQRHVGGRHPSGGVTAGIDIALTIVAEIAGEDTAKMIQLMIEYAPAPPFNSGSPETASPETVKAVKSRFAAFAEQRRAAIDQIVEGV